MLGALTSSWQLLVRLENMLQPLVLARSASVLVGIEALSMCLTCCKVELVWCVSIVAVRDIPVNEGRRALFTVDKPGSW